MPLLPSQQVSRRDVLHGRQVEAMFGRIAGYYDVLNHVLSLGMDLYWRWRLARAARPGPDGLVLDLAAGTLDVSRALCRMYPGVSVAAVDFTRPMLERGLPKLKRAELLSRVFPVQGDGRRLPLPDECCDAVTIAFGIRNIRPRMAAHREALRVLRPGGRFCILEFGTGRRKVWGGLYNFYLNRVLPGIGRVISGDGAAYRYLAESIRGFPDERELARELLDAGFARVFHVAMLSGIVYLHVAEKQGVLASAEVPADVDGDLLRCFTPEDPGLGPEDGPEGL